MLPLVVVPGLCLGWCLGCAWDVAYGCGAWFVPGMVPGMCLGCGLWLWCLGCAWDVPGMVPGMCRHGCGAVMGTLMVPSWLCAVMVVVPSWLWCRHGCVLSWLWCRHGHPLCSVMVVCRHGYGAVMVVVPSWLCAVMVVVPSWAPSLFRHGCVPSWLWCRHACGAVMVVCRHGCGAVMVVCRHGCGAVMGLGWCLGCGMLPMVVVPSWCRVCASAGRWKAGCSWSPAGVSVCMQATVGACRNSRGHQQVWVCACRPQLVYVVIVVVTSRCGCACRPQLVYVVIVVMLTGFSHTTPLAGGLQPGLQACRVFAYNKLGRLPC